MTQLHQLIRSNQKKSARVGRGGRRGKTSGRGTKGQNARAGHRKRPELRDIIKKVPKLRGHGKNRARTVNDSRVKSVPVSLARLEKAFAAGETVSPRTLALKGVVKTRGGKSQSIVIVAGGDLTKKLTVSLCRVTKSAKAAIEKAGGAIE